MNLKLLAYKLRRFLLGLLYAGKTGGFSSRPYINGVCKFSASVSGGKNVHFNGSAFYGGGAVEIGENFHSGRGCIFLTANHRYHGEALPYDHHFVKKGITIGDNVWFGINVTVLPGVKVGEGAVIQAGSVVSKSIPPLAIAGGNPAEVIRYRDSEHYYRLKEMERFC
jgi:maltose O-acetyltransferase